MVILVNDQKPWGFRGEGGDLKGASVDFALALGKELDHPFDIDVAPYHRLLKDFEAGRIDYTFFLEDQKPDGAIPVVKLIDVDIVVVGRSGLEINRVEDLQGLRVGKIRGALYSDKLMLGQQGFECIEIHSYRQAIDLLKKGRLDAILGTPLPIVYAAKDMGVHLDFFGDSFLFDQKAAWIYTTQQSQHRDKVKDIQAAVEKMIKNNVLSDIAATYLEFKH